MAAEMIASFATDNVGTVMTTDVQIAKISQLKKYCFLYSNQPTLENNIIWAIGLVKNLVASKQQQLADFFSFA